MDKHYYSEKLDDYLSNSLSEAEKQTFEQILQKDPVLRQDLEIQRETVEQLQILRKAQIKARLNNINVHEGSRHQLTRWIWIGSAAAVLLFGIFSWNLIKPLDTPSENKIEKSNQIFSLEKQDKRVQKTEDEQNLPPKEESKDKTVELAENESLSTQQIAPQYVAAKVNSTQIASQKEVLGAKHTKEVANLELASENSLVFHYPNAEERDAYTFEINPEEELKGVFDGSEPPSLEEQDKQNQLRYQHYDEQIFTNTDFKFGPIMMMVGNQQKTFVYHEGYFYELLTEQYEQKPAAKVHNHTLIDRLKAEIEKRIKP